MLLYRFITITVRPIPACYMYIFVTKFRKESYTSDVRAQGPTDVIAEKQNKTFSSFRKLWIYAYALRWTNAFITRSVRTYRSKNNIEYLETVATTEYFQRSNETISQYTRASSHQYQPIPQHNNNNNEVVLYNLVIIILAVVRIVPKMWVVPILIRCREYIMTITIISITSFRRGEGYETFVRRKKIKLTAVAEMTIIYSRIAMS